MNLYIVFLTNFRGMDMKNNMDMNNTNIKAKKVFFAECTKEIDGTSQMNVKYFTLISKFLKGHINNSIDVYKFVKYEPKLLPFFFTQVVIAILMLKIVQKTEKSTISIRDKIYKQVPVKDIGELDIMKVWDTSIWNKRAHLKSKTLNGVGILRHGSRDFSGSFTTQHIIHLQELAVMILKTRKLLLENASV